MTELEKKEMLAKAEAAYADAEAAKNKLAEIGVGMDISNLKAELDKLKMLYAASTESEKINLLGEERDEDIMSYLKAINLKVEKIEFMFLKLHNLLNDVTPKE